MARYISRFMIFSSVSLPEVKNYDIFAFLRVVLRLLCQTVRVKEQVFLGYVHIVPDRETEHYRKCTSNRSSAHTRKFYFPLSRIALLRSSCKGYSICNTTEHLFLFLFILCFFFRQHNEARVFRKHFIPHICQGN